MANRNKGAETRNHQRRLLPRWPILDILWGYFAAHHPAMWGVLIALAPIVGFLRPRKPIRQALTTGSSTMYPNWGADILAIAAMD